MYPTHFYWQMRAMGRKYSQLQQLVWYLMREPGHEITVVVPDKVGKKQFLDFAKYHGVIFKTGRLKKWGNNWCYNIKSFERTK